MKRHEILFWSLKLPLEFSLVILAFFMARSIRLVTDLIPGVQLPIHTIDTIPLLIFALTGALLFVIVFAINGLYVMKISSSKIREFWKIITASLQWFLIYIACIYLSVDYLYSIEIPRLILFFALGIILILISLERLIVTLIYSSLLFHKKLSKRKLLLLMASSEDSLLDSLDTIHMYEIIGYANNQPLPSLNGILPYIGGYDEIITHIKERTIDEIIMIHTSLNNQQKEEIFEYSRIYGIYYRYAANLFEVSSGKTELDFIARIPFIQILSIGLNPWWRVIKRSVDILFSFFVILIGSPFFLFIIILIWLIDGNSPFYVSQRVGRHGRIFSMIKFQTMIKNAESIKHQLLEKNERKDGPLFKIENDPRVTSLGRFLRKYDIDELPQIFNVLLGTMSLIGPRPHLPEEVRLYKEYQKRVLTLKPGITGLAQVNGRHKNSFNEEVRLDTFYIENWSLFMDIKIFIKTIAVILKRRWR